MSSSFLKKCCGLVRKRCPRCTEGCIYDAGMRMHPTCPACGLRYEREPGYFIGSLYISYALATIIMLIGLGLGCLVLPTWDLGTITLIVGALFIPLTPAVTRYSRVLWMYFDLWAWPAGVKEAD